LRSTGKKSYARPTLRKLNVQQLRTVVSKQAKEFLELIFSRPGNRDCSAEAKSEAPRQYQSPALRKLTPDQAKLLLIGHASMGDEGAREILELLFPESDGAN